MIYHLFTYLNQFDFPGAGMFQYLSSRAAFAAITSLVISMIIGKRIIHMLRSKQIGESVRDLGLEGQAVIKADARDGLGASTDGVSQGWFDEAPQARQVLGRSA